MESLQEIRVQKKNGLPLFEEQQLSKANKQ